MKRNFLMFLITWFFFLGCVSAPYPKNKKELNPRLTSQTGHPNEVLFVIKGEAPAVGEVYEGYSWKKENKPPVYTWNDAGRKRDNGLWDSRVNGRLKEEINIFTRRFPKGYYRVIVRPFYYEGFGKNRRVAELWVREYGFSVYADPSRLIYDRDTRRYWAAVVYIDTGHLPHHHGGQPPVRINVYGNGFPGYILDRMR